MSKRTNPGTWLAFMVLLTILVSATAQATTIDIDGGSAGNDLVAPGGPWIFFIGSEPPSTPPVAW